MKPKTRLTALENDAKREKFCASLLAMSILSGDGDDPAVREVAAIYRQLGARAMIRKLAPRGNPDWPGPKK